MRTFTIDYDLCKPGQDYESLLNCLRRLGARRLLQSKWILSSSSTATLIRDTLRKLMDSNDRLFVAEISGEWASWNALINVNELQAEAAPNTR